MTLKQAEQSHIELRYTPHLYAEQAWVMADRHRLLQVLLNLVSNAIKYNHPQGHVEIVIDQDLNNSWQVLVIDTGIGISTELEQKLFSPFARADDHRVEGTGLGLAVSKSLIEAMQGQLGWQRRDTEGSIFWFSLSKIRPPQGAGYE